MKTPSIQLTAVKVVNEKSKVSPKELSRFDFEPEMERRENVSLFDELIATDLPSFQTSWGVV